MTTEVWYGFGGIPRKAKEVWYGFGGMPRKAKEIWYRSGGTWRKVFAGGFQSISAMAGSALGLAEPGTTPGMAALEMFVDGTYRFEHSDADSNMIYDALVNWGTPTTPGLGSEYQTLTTHVSGNAALPGHGTWRPLGAGVRWHINGLASATSVRTSTFDISIRQGNGPILSTGSVTLSARSTAILNP